MHLIELASWGLTLAFAACAGRHAVLHRAWPRAGKGRVALLVIAHPDDESMFFVPAMRSLLSAGWKLHVLCVSKGLPRGGDNPSERASELRAALSQIGHSISLAVVDELSLQDGSIWSPIEIAQLVRKRVTVSKAALVLTFDEAGVSGHPNHIALFNGVSLYCTGRPSTVVPCYSLESVTLLRKFTGLLDIFTTFMGAIFAWLLSSCSSHGLTRDAHAEETVLVTNSDILLPHRAMSCHRSQYVWFRRLSVMFSRYGYINTFKRI